MKSLSLLGLLVAAGCTAGTASFEGDQVFKPGDVSTLREALATQGDGPNGAHIIFLNFDGQHIQPATNGGDDPDTGASWIATKSVQYAAFDATPYAPQFTADTAKAGIVNYFKQFYAPFNVQVVTTRPQGLRYTMCMIGDQPATILGTGGNTAGVAPLDCGNRDESEITYAFAAALAPGGQFGDTPTGAIKSVAVTAAQETAHAFGLNHTNSNTDIMYPQLDPNQNQFVDMNLGMLNNPGGTCNGATSQNSKQLLGSNIGFSTGGGPTGPTPTVKFVAPTNNATVPMNFTIIVDASETGGSIAHVDLSSGSQSLFSYMTPPYRSDVSAPAEGQFQITATAFDSAGNFQSATVTFTASKTAPPQQLPPCQSSAECPSGQMCTSGMCVASSGTTGTNGGTTGGTTGGGTTGGGTTGSGATSGGIIMGIPTGGDCSKPDGSECQGAACYQGDPDHHYCTNVCDPSVAESCPAGMMCTKDGPGVFLCTYPKQSHGCSAAPGQPGDAAFGFILMMGLVAVLRLRRARG